MAIISVELKSILPSGDLTSEKLIEKYRVITDANENAHTVYHSGHPELPQKGDTRTEGMVVTNVEMEEVSVGDMGQQVFLYIVTWSIGIEEGVIDPNPLNRIEMHMTGLEFSEPAHYDQSTPLIRGR